MKHQLSRAIELAVMLLLALLGWLALCLAWWGGWKLATR